MKKKPDIKRSLIQRVGDESKKHGERATYILALIGLCTAWLEQRSTTNSNHAESTDRIAKLEQRMDDAVNARKAMWDVINSKQDKPQKK